MLLLLSKRQSRNIQCCDKWLRCTKPAEIPASVKRELTTHLFCCRSWDFFLLLKISYTCYHDVFLTPIYYVATDSRLLI